MKQFILSVIFLAVILNPDRIFSQKSTINLNSNYQMKIGDYSALMFSGFLKIRTDLDAPVIATYELEPNTIDIEIFGARSTVEGAKETVQNYLQFIQTTHIPYISRRFGVTLTDHDYRIIYYDRTNRGGSKAIIQYIKGQYTLP